jgi:rhodanese-related sulfurtransferase
MVVSAPEKQVGAVSWAHARERQVKRMDRFWFWWWPFGRVSEIPARELHALLHEGGPAPQLLDVRTVAEWEAGHVAGALNVPVLELGTRLAELELDPGRRIVAICRSAHRSIPAVRLLQRHGFARACQLQGGMLAWQAAALPVVGAPAATSDSCN